MSMFDRMGSILLVATAVPVVLGGVALTSMRLRHAMKENNLKTLGYMTIGVGTVMMVSGYMALKPKN